MLAPPSGGLLPVTSRQELRAQVEKEKEEARKAQEALEAVST